MCPKSCLCHLPRLYLLGLIHLEIKMYALFTQFFPPTAALTEENIPSQKGRVFIVTGGASGIGFQLSAILYRAGGSVYIAGRSKEDAQRSIQKIESSSEGSGGKLVYLPLHLEDLSTIKASVETFKSKETKLDVLWNNAGVSLPPVGSKSCQGHELMLATNCLGSFLLTQLLRPLLETAAKTSPLAAVRVVWTSTQVVDMNAPREGIIMADLTGPGPVPVNQTRNYVTSKTGNWFLASELGREVAPRGILSLVQNPGNVNTNLLRHVKWMKFFSLPLLHNAKFGAYTELWSGLSSDLTMEHTGAYVIPWGRLHPSPRQDLLDALQPKESRGTGVANEFWGWCLEQISEYM